MSEKLYRIQILDPAQAELEDVARLYCSLVGPSSARKITDGTTDTTFSPDKDCTRAEIVTFLYRSTSK